MTTNPPIPPYSPQPDNVPPYQGNIPPYGPQQPGRQPPLMPPQPSPNNAAKSGLTTAGLVLGIIAVVFAFIPLIGAPVGIPLGVLALIFGIIGIIKKHGGKAIAATALGAGAVILATVMMVSVFGATKSAVESINSAAASASSALGNISGDNTEQLLKTDVTVEFGTFTVAADGYTTSLPTTVTNITQKQHSYSITVTASAPDGSQVATDSLYVTDLAAGQSTQKPAFQFVSSDKAAALKTATYKVTTLSVLN